jgi:hypothetical protein
MLGGGAWHTPTAVPVAVQTSEAGQPLPPVARQPGTQRALVGSQMRPDVAPPQSVSIAQPHEPPATQRPPLRSTRQALWLAVVHSAQVRIEVSHTNGAAQSVSTRHCTQRSTLSVMSQRPSGAAQSPSAAHEVAVVHAPTPPVTTHVWFVGHPLCPGPQPGSQKPFGPLQMKPEVAPPHAASVVQPHRPVATMHWGSRPTHAAPFVAEHSVHAPASGPVFSQTGCAASGQLGAPSATQPVQVCVVAEQTGVVPPQSALPRHATQTPPPPVVSHSGALAVQ